MIMNLVARLFGSNAHDGSDELLVGADPRERARAITDLVDPIEALGVELGRARRYEHALSIVVASPRPLTPDRPERNALLVRLGGKPPQALSYLTAAGLREILRTSDIVAWDPDEEHFVLGLAESDRTTARRAMQRVRSLFEERLGVGLDVGVAQFPADGLTLEDLIGKAREELVRGQSVASIASRDEPPANGNGRARNGRGHGQAAERGGGRGARKRRSPRDAQGPAAALDARAAGGGE